MAGVHVQKIGARETDGAHSYLFQRFGAPCRFGKAIMSASVSNLW